MPVVSFSISESLRKFLRNLVKGGRYKNNSYVIRAALSQMMDSYQEGDIMADSFTDENTIGLVEQITGNVMIIVDKFNSLVERKLSRIEFEFRGSIKSKNAFYHLNKKTIVYIIEDNLDKFRSFITDLNQIEDLNNIRYIIL
jgi:Arc/MetJ-type ribon-helix-helix transcriptional regulator